MTTKPDLRPPSPCFRPSSYFSTLPTHFDPLDSQFAAAVTPYNVGSVQWRLFSTLEAVQYIGGIASELCGIASVPWRLLSTVEDNISTVWIISVLWRIFSTVVDTFSTVGVTAVHVGDTFSPVGIPSVLQRLLSTMGDRISTVGDSFSTVGDSFSTVEGIQYIGEITSLHTVDDISTVGG